jgi:hypothetical protein
MDAALLVEPPLTAADVARGVARLFWAAGAVAQGEFTLACGRRADLAVLWPSGELALVEIKVSAADLKGDAKWPDYLDWCDRFFWAVPPDLAPLLDAPGFAPGHAGLIVADRHGAALLRDAAAAPLPAARRKAMHLRFARVAAARLMCAADPSLALRDPAL